MSNFIVYSKVNDSGQEIYRFTLSGRDCVPAISIENNYKDTAIDCFLAMKTGRKSKGIEGAEVKDGVLTIDCAPFSIESNYILHVGEETYTAKDVTEVKTLWADEFEGIKEEEVNYRLYRPSAKGARPLILFLHGGGEAGTDNWRQLVGCYGPTALAEAYPDCYIMAPQARGLGITPDMKEMLKHQTFANGGALDSRTTGWNREYLASIMDIIRRMVKEGLVEPKRIYVTGFSMGGAGTLRALSVGPDLFAAAVCICPSMTPETYQILCGLTHTKIWVACSYLDHSYYRHKYIVDGIMKLRDEGNRDAKLTIYPPEDLAKYDIGTIEDMPLEAKAGWNHICWVPTYHNEYGIMSWMMDQSR